jgi:hypothetical protein
MAAFHTPVAPIVPKNLLCSGLIDRDAGDAIDYFPTHLPRLFTDRFPLDHKRLANMREVEIVIQFRGDPDGSFFDSSVFATAGMGIVGCVGRSLETGGEIFEQCWLIPLYREVVVCPPFLHQISSQITLREQGVRSDGSTFNLNGIEHRRRRLDFIGLFFFVTAFYRQCADFFWV